MRLSRAVARFGGGGFAAGGWLMLAACAVAPPAVPVTAEFATIETPFTAEGRLSARRGSDAVAVQFAWNHQPPRDELAVRSQFGQTIAQLSGDTSTKRVEVRGADGRHEEAADWTTLTERALGFPLPVTNLTAWIRAAPRGGAAYMVEGDREGRVSVLRQDGWEVVYDYADSAARAPSRLRITYPDLEIRVVIDRWQ